MAQYFSVHPDNPQPRLIRQAVDIIRDGGVIAYPTDSCYALGCHIGDKGAMERLRRIRDVDERHHFTLVCRDLSEIGQFAKEIGADLIVVGHKPQSLMQRWWSGASGGYISEHVGCSLLVGRKTISDEAFSAELERSGHL